ncbi:MAG: LTA synthase family protein [Lachnospiraceae bacterium]|nr:LTA synthase family protein [Lachnospiraceae bacterium]
MSKECRSKKILFVVMVLGILWMYATYVPYLLDYYIIRPETSVFSFVFGKDIINTNYEFEGVIIGLGLGLLYCVTANVGVSVSVMSLGLLLLTHASYIKYINRKELLRINDLKLTEAAGMAAGYIHFNYSRYLLLLVIFFLLSGAACFGLGLLNKQAGKIISQRRLQFAVRVVCAIVLCVVTVKYTDYYFNSKLTLDEVKALSLNGEENNRYVLYRFLQNDSLYTSVGDPQASYQNLLSQSPVSETKEGAQKPDIIVIMNESWWNTDHIASDKVVFSKDPMEPYKKLEDKCITGWLTSNVYGGGTVSSEAEFLTGLNTKYFVQTSTFYANTLGRKIPSVVDYLHELEYDTEAIHPYYGEFYSRDQVYQTFGFDRILFAEDMQYKDIYTKYISDESLANQIISDYERPGENKFIWALSIANHIRVLEYEAEPKLDYDYPISAELEEGAVSQEDYDTMINYINGIYLANQAFEQLVEYFERVDKPVILVMYGDHIPSFPESVMSAFELNTDDQSVEMMKKTYSVPVILWSNLKNRESNTGEWEGRDEPEFRGQAIYYLAEMIFSYAGLPDSDMMRIKRLERSEFLADTRTMVLDRNGEPMTRCSQKQLYIMKNMQTVEYDLMFGENMCGDIWKPGGAQGGDTP